MSTLTMSPECANLLNPDLKTDMGRAYLDKIKNRLALLTGDDLVNAVADLQYEFEKATPIFQAISEYLEESGSPYSEDLDALNKALMSVLETFPEP